MHLQFLDRTISRTLDRNLLRYEAVVGLDFEYRDNYSGFGWVRIRTVKLDEGTGERD